MSPANTPQPAAAPAGGEFVLFQTEDAQTRVQVRLIDGVLWLSQRQMAELYQKDVRTVNEHLKNVYADGELNPDATIRKFRIVAREGARDVERLVDHYNLDAVLQVGYRVRSPRGAQFRQLGHGARSRPTWSRALCWTMSASSAVPMPDYFEELLARIRDIRSSEKMFWRKVLDIYATSVDYDPVPRPRSVFCHGAEQDALGGARPHGGRADRAAGGRQQAERGLADMGCAAPAGGLPRKADVSVAKNYLTEDELQVLNRIVNAYLEFAELQA
jgi:hypothetical protein